MSYIKYSKNDPERIAKEREIEKHNCKIILEAENLCIDYLCADNEERFEIIKKFNDLAIKIRIL